LQAMRQFCIIKRDRATTSISLVFKRPIQIKTRPIPDQGGSEQKNSRLIGIFPDRQVHQRRDLRVEDLVNRRPGEDAGLQEPALIGVTESAGLITAQLDADEMDV
jgi:hypothetical protein